jgi:LmbE family N-acetylglucosaminyl deacetylase
VLSDASTAFPGTLVFLAPHMDDEVLAGGGTIAGLDDKARVHVVYVTDGAKSPVPAFPWISPPSADLPSIRRAEARAALQVLGVPARNGHFLNFPDGELQAHTSDLRQALLSLLEQIRPSSVFIPFRYDRHPDHLVLHRVAIEAVSSLGLPVGLIEYFVYYRWRLLPGGDVRHLISSEYLVRIDITDRSDDKRRALRCYASQTTRFFEWQDRPILPPERVYEVSQSPELFLRNDPSYPGAAIFARLKPWVPIAHRVEPALKRGKDTIQIFFHGLSKSVKA